MFVYWSVCICTCSGLTSCFLHFCTPAAQTLKQFADEETFTYSESLMLEGDFETLIDNAESGVDEYMAFKDTI